MLVLNAQQCFREKQSVADWRRLGDLADYAMGPWQGRQDLPLTPIDTFKIPRDHPVFPAIPCVIYQ
eukprot:1139547-Pelagomonas_calceolata.AAC.8